MTTLPSPPPGFSFADPNPDDQLPPPPPGFTPASPTPTPQPQQSTLDWLGTQMGYLAKPKPGTHPTLWQRARASDVGGLVHGALVEAPLGAAQLLARASSYLSPAGPGADPSINPARDYIQNLMDTEERNYQSARAASGIPQAKGITDVANYDWPDIAGNVVSPINWFGGGEARVGKGVLDVAPQVAESVLPKIEQGARPVVDFLKRMAATAPKGAMYGALQPVYSTGNQVLSDADYAKQKAEQMAAGFFAAPLVHAGTTGVVNAAGTLGRLGSRALGLTGDIGDQTAAYISRVLGYGGKTPEQIAATGAQNAGRGMTFAEAAGPPGVRHLMTLGRRFGNVGEALASRIDQRAEAAPGRVLTDFGQSAEPGVNPTTALSDVQDIVKTGQAEAKPMFDTAFTGGSIAPLLPSLERSFQDADAQVVKAEDALKKAQTGATLVAGGHLPTENVYGASSAFHAKNAAQAEIDAAQNALDLANVNKDKILQVMGQAQSDAANGVKGGIWSPELERALSDQDARTGMANEIRNMQIYGNARNQPVNLHEIGVKGFDENGMPIISAVPKMQIVHAAKLGLDEMINEAKNQIGQVGWTRRLDALNELRDTIVSEARRLNPEYGAALDRAGDYLSVKSAFNRAQNIITDPDTSVAQFQKFWDGLKSEVFGPGEVSPQQLGAQRGIGNKLFTMQQNAKLTSAGIKRNLLTPNTKGKLAIALGPDQAQTFINNLGLETDLGRTGARMYPNTNSVTGDIGLATREMDQPIPIQAAKDFIGILSSLASGKLTKAGGHLASLADVPGMVQRAGELPQAVGERAGDILMGTPEQGLEYLRQLQARGMLGRRFDIPGTLAPMGARLVTAPAITQQQQPQQ